jgi:hypothetical protein
MNKENKKIKRIMKEDNPNRIVKEKENIVEAEVTQVLVLPLIRMKEEDIRIEVRVLKKSTKNRKKLNKKRNIIEIKRLIDIAFNLIYIYKFITNLL